MDQKAWLWRKKSSEKTIVANGKADIHVKGNEEEVQLPNEKEVALEKSVKSLNERLTSLKNEFNAKEEELENHAKMAQGARAGQEKAEAELLHLRKELDDASLEKVAANERTSSLNAALKDCMQQLNSLREEQEQRVHDAIMRTSKDFEKAHNRLEEKLSDTSKRIANLSIENSHLGKVLVIKENLIEELTSRSSQVEAEFDALMSRLDSVEKENAFLRYEFRMLEKDLDIRNEEIEFSRGSVEATEKQMLESVKKIKKLEAECQRLRVLVRKRIPGSTALANIKSEVEVHGRYNTETRRRKLNPKGGEDLDISNKRISFLVERLQNVEQENKILRDALATREKDICHSITECTQIISRSPNVGTETGDHHKTLEPMELTVPLSNELSSTSGFSNYAESNSNCSRSWASALISELENFKDGEFKTTPDHQMIGTSDMSLMDDFVEMEKLAIVTVDLPNKSSQTSDIHHVLPDSSKGDKCLNDVDSTGKELVPVGNDDLGNMNRELETNGLSFPQQSDWLHTVLKVITEQVRFSERSIDELLEDIKIAFQSEGERSRNLPHSGKYELVPITGYITWKSPVASPRLNSSKRVSDFASGEEKMHESIQPISSSIGKIIELVRRFASTCSNGSTLPSDQLTADEDYAIHVFGWKSCELAIVVQQFICTCDSLLNGIIDFEKFAAELSSTLGWILERSIKNQDNSGVRYEFKHLFGENGSGTSTEHESLQKFLSEMEKVLSVLEVENKGLKSELALLKSLQKDVEQSLQLARDDSKTLTSEVEQSQENIRSLQLELEALRESKRMIEDQFENQKLINEDLDTQLTVAKVKLSEVSQKLSSLEVELEDKSHSCEELEGTCLELQLQLESIASNGILKDNINQEEKLLQTGWEIKAASAKLAECEATIFNLGNQLKALASPKEASNSNKILYNYRSKKLNQHFSLLDRMISEDNAKTEVIESPKTKEIHQMNSQSAVHASSVQLEASEADMVSKDEEAKTALAGALVVVPSKKKGGGFNFLRKLLLRRKRQSSHNHKTFFPFSP